VLLYRTSSTSRAAGDCIVCRAQAISLFSLRSLDELSVFAIGAPTSACNWPLGLGRHPEISSSYSDLTLLSCDVGRDDDRRLDSATPPSVLNWETWTQPDILSPQIRRKRVVDAMFHWMWQIVINLSLLTRCYRKVKIMRQLQKKKHYNTSNQKNQKNQT